jgi:cell division control protein 12
MVDFDDVRIHACLYFISPTGHILSALDIQAMKELGTRVNLIPVIAKADTLMPAEIQEFKQRVILHLITKGDVSHFVYQIRDCIQVHGIQIYQSPIDDEDEELARIQQSIQVRI